jgi:hypothetical protein
MSSRPTRKIQPTAKLTAENAGDLELSSHRRAVTSASLAAPHPQGAAVTPSSTIPEPLESTSAPGTGLRSSPDPVQAPTATSTSTKRPHPRPLLRATTIPDDESNSTDIPDEAPKAKKAKTTPHQAGSGLHADTSIIEIDDGNDLQSERLNKIDPTADIKVFFIAVPRVQGQNKGRMKCNLCV